MLEEFSNTPGNRNSIVGGSAASNLIEDDQTALRYIIQNAGRFIHLDQEGGFSCTQIIRSAHPRKNFICKWYPCLGGRNKTTHMRHQGNKCCLPEQGALTAHIWARKDNDLLRFRIQVEIIRNIFLSVRQRFFNYRVTAVFKLQFSSRVQLRFFII